jgi:octaprenyl-diphosphate synthase
VAFDFLARELALVERVIARSVAGDERTLSTISQYVVGAGGKRVRPALVLASYAAASGKQARKAVPAAAAVEVIHTATLIHDDISDRSDKRRGSASAHERFGIGRSLIAADYLMTTAFKLISEYGVEFISTINGACMSMAIGEIHDLRHTGNARLTVDEYYDIIERKTGALFEAGAKVGAMAARAPGPRIAAFGRYGRQVGIAFQVIDDTLDVSASAERMGKPVGKDLSEGKVTLPTIFALEHAPSRDRALLKRVIEAGREGGGHADVARAVKAIRKTGAEAYCRQVAARHTRRAKAALRPVPASPAKDALLDFADDLAARGA